MEGNKLSYQEAYNRVIKIFPEFKTAAEMEIQIIRKFVKSDSKILDVGCGFGRVMKELSPFCEKIAGIDVDPSEIESSKIYLRDIENIELFAENACGTHFPNGYFDLILFLGNTFGNVSEKKENVMKEVKRILRKGGKIFIEVNKLESIKERADAFNKIGMKVEKVEGGKIFIEGGLISECFTKRQLEKTFMPFKFKIDYINLIPLSFFCVLTKS